MDLKWIKIAISLSFRIEFWSTTPLPGDSARVKRGSAATVDATALCSDSTAM